MASLNELRRTKNELIVQRRNTSIAQQVEKLAPSNAGAELPLQFICECSDLTCTERITMEIQEYLAATRLPARFIVRPSHQQPDIETTLNAAKDYVVVEKRKDLIQQFK